jgi:hypothetical protein
MKNTLTALALLASTSLAGAVDLPSGKAQPQAPANYVKVCDVYGSGFFYIPGTDSCLRVGGMVRQDFAYVPSGDTYKVTSGARAINTYGAGQNTTGWETRGRIDLDARTPTDFGTVRTAAGIRFSRSSGTLADVANPTGASQSATTTTPIMEYAYIQFAGLTAGAARDNFQFMPSAVYSAQHWASFIINPKQVAYTATLGGGLSATIAVQDATDTAIAPVDGVNATTTYYAPQNEKNLNLVGNVRWDQPWGTVQVMGAGRQAQVLDTTGLTYNQEKGVWAAGAGAKINLPFTGHKDNALWLTGAYADGMTEYTTAYGSNKIANWKRDLNGWQFNQPSIIAYSTGVETVKSWNAAALYQHWLTDKYRINAFGSYGQIQAPETAKALVFDAKKGFGDAKVWSVGSNFAWLPTKDFELGIEGIYSNMKQDVRYTLASSTNKVEKESDSNWTMRLRAERRF